MSLVIKAAREVNKLPSIERQIPNECKRTLKYLLNETPWEGAVRDGDSKFIERYVQEKLENLQRIFGIGFADIADSMKNFYAEKILIVSTAENNEKIFSEIIDKNPELIGSVSSYLSVLSPLLEFSMSAKYIYNGYNLAQIASRTGSLDVLQILLKKNPALIQSKTDWDLSLLHLVVSNSALDEDRKIEVCEFLLQQEPRLLTMEEYEDRMPIGFVHDDTSEIFKFLAEKHREIGQEITPRIQREETRENPRSKYLYIASVAIPIIASVGIFLLNKNRRN